MLHPILNCLKGKILNIISLNQPRYDFSIIENFRLPENDEFDKFKGNIGWAKITPNYTFDFSNSTNQEINEMLKSSILNKHQTLLIEIRYEGPVVELKVEDFVESWEEILHASVEGFPVVSKDGACVLEFINDEQLIYSNFPISSS